MEQTISESHRFVCPHCGLAATVIVHTESSQTTEIEIQALPRYTKSTTDIDQPVLREEVEAFVHKAETALTEPTEPNEELELANLHERLEKWRYHRK